MKSTFPDPERWARIEGAFEGAVGLDPEERRIFLDSLESDDPEVRLEVEALLAADRDAGEFLETDPLEDLSEGSAAPPEAELEAGERLGPWEIGTEIGRGGMSRVYLARRVEGGFEQQVAVKVLSTSGLSAGESRARFEAERRILAALEHRSIAAVLDGGTTASGQPYLVMEFVRGRPVTEWAKAAAASLSARLRLMVEVCEAVEHAHRRLVVHRDLKPANILVTDEGSVRLLDFGIAKLLEASARPAGGSPALPATRTGVFLMTPEYAAPEQVAGGAITTATDVYALGVLLYELVTGGRPYELEGSSPAQIERSIRDTDPKRPSTAVTGSVPQPVKRWAGRVRGDLDTIILKCLRKEPEQRYGSAQEVADDLRRFLEGQPIEARPATFGYLAAKFLRRHPLGASAAALGLLMLLGFAAAMTYQRGVTQQERDRARAAEVQSEAINRFLVDGLLGSAAPEAAAGLDVSVLDTAARRIEGAFPEQPALEASLRRTLGRLYLSHGRVSAAREQIERADRLAVEELGPDHPDALAGRRLLAEVDLAAGRFDKALVDLEALRGRLAKLLPADHPQRLAAEGTLARAEQAAGDYAAAEERLRAALTRLGPAGGETADTRLELIGRLVEVYVDQRRWDDVERVGAQLLALQREQLGPNHPRIGATLASLGVAQSRNKHHPEAETSLLESLDLRRRVLGEQHPDTLESLRELASHFRRLRDLEQANEYARLDLQIARKTLGPTHPWTLRSEQIVGILHTLDGRDDLAEPIYRRVARLQEEALGPDHPSTIRSYKNLNSLLLRMGRIDDAREAALRALEGGRLRAAQAGDDPTNLNDHAYYLVTCDPEDLRRPLEALPLAERAVELTGRSRASFLDTLARVRYELGDLDAAIGLQSEVLRLPEAVSFLSYERYLVEYLLEAGRPEEAEEELERHLERRVAARGPDAAIVGATRRHLGRVAARQGEWGRAAEELARAVSIFEAAAQQDDFQLWRARSELGEALVELGRLGEAEALLAPAAEALAGRTWFNDTTTHLLARERLARLRSLQRS